MFSKELRLQARVQFQNAQIIHTPFFSLRFMPNSLGHNRYGFVISKKVAKSAVDRNRAKRKVRACIEKLHERLNRGYDMLFLIKEKAIEVTSQEICYITKQHLRQKGLL